MVTQIVTALKPATTPMDLDVDMQWLHAIVNVSKKK